MLDQGWLWLCWILFPESLPVLCELGEWGEVVEKSRRISTYGPRLSFYIPLSRYSHNQGCGNPNPFSHFQPPLKLRGSWPACRANLKPQPRSARSWSWTVQWQPWLGKKEVGWEKDGESCNQGDTARQGENKHLKQSLGNCLQEDRSWAFPGGPVVRTPHFHCRGHGFNPWLGTWDSASHSQSKKKKKNHSREVLKLEETMKDNGADTTDLQVRDLGCTEGLRQQQGWKAGFLAPGGFILEGAEGELQLLGAGWGPEGRSVGSLGLQREQEVFREVKVPEELGIRTNWIISQIHFQTSHLQEGHDLTNFSVNKSCPPCQLANHSNRKLWPPHTRPCCSPHCWLSLLPTSTLAVRCQSLTHTHTHTHSQWFPIVYWVKPTCSCLSFNSHPSLSTVQLIGLLSFHSAPKVCLLPCSFPEGPSLFTLPCFYLLVCPFPPFPPLPLKSYLPGPFPRTPSLWDSPWPLPPSFPSRSHHFLLSAPTEEKAGYFSTTSFIKVWLALHNTGFLLQCFLMKHFTCTAKLSEFSS